MISHRHRCIFVHIPKNAGTSVDAVFGERHDYACHRHPHRYTEWSDPNFFRFTFTRNPFDRLVSAFSYMMQHAGPRRPFENWRPAATRRVAKWAKFAGFRDDFRGFVDEVVKLDPELVASDAEFQHIRPQSRWIVDGYDFIGRVEDLQAGFDFVCDSINLARQRLPVRNSTRHAPFTSCYDVATREAAAHFYAEDLQRFGYTFDG
jgi:hypothetical protein